MTHKSQNEVWMTGEEGLQCNESLLIQKHPWFNTLTVSRSTWMVFSLKSTPIVASVFSGKCPPQKRNVRQVLPTLESPITMILKILLFSSLSMTAFWVSVSSSLLIFLANVGLQIWREVTLALPSVPCVRNYCFRKLTAGQKHYWHLHIHLAVTPCFPTCQNSREILVFHRKLYHFLHVT